MKLCLIPNELAFVFLSQFEEFTKHANWTNVVRKMTRGESIPMRCIGVYHNDELVGAFPMNIGKQLRAHVCFKSAYRGRFAMLAARKAISWVLDNTPYSEIYAESDLKHAQRFAALCGMQRDNKGFKIANV